MSVAIKVIKMSFVGILSIPISYFNAIVTTLSDDGF
jgi:hypothetical protein